ncbi:MAG: extracellular solute-binding protein [Clostridia bacterium]|nr:extracellular solute-binding protein [Clostridia bacterium]
MFKKVLSICLAALMLVAIVPSISAPAVSAASAVLESGNSYAKYLEDNSAFSAANEEVVIDALKNYTADKELSVTEVDGKEFLLTADEGYTEWTFTVPTAALYRIAAVWANVGGKGLDIIRRVSVDGKVLFDGLNSVYFRRSWKNVGNKYVDISGNEYSQKLEEEVTVQTSNFYSFTDYCAGGYALALTEGEHTIRFESVQEPMAINSILLTPAEEYVTYKEKLNEYKAAGYNPVSADVKPIIIEAENATYTSKNTIRPVADRSSPAVSPYDSIKKLLNSMGGNSWNESAQWIEWNFTAEESGLYQITLHAKQDFKSGFSSARRLLIDGETPFKEANYIEIDYDLNWQNITLGNGEEPYLVYIEKGDHTLRLEVSITEAMSEILTKSEKLQDELTAFYRRIIMVTGTMPDSLRDYNLFSTVENCKETIESALKDLNDIVDSLEALGYSGSETSTMNRLIIQLEGFLEDDNTIPDRLSTFNTNVMSFSSWITTAKQQPVLIDNIYIASPKSEVPAADCGFFKKAFTEIYRLLMSFVTDYDVMDSTGSADNKGEIKLWIGLGIDQSIVLKSLIDGGFTPKSNINVNIELVNMGVLLRAVAADVGPDIALFQGQSTPVEYAMRGAVYDLKNFSDLDSVLERFYPSAYESFKYEGGLYALPGNQTFSMMFYRTDILEELGVKAPNTWQELYSVLAKFQTNYLSVSLPSPFVGGAGMTGLNSVYMMLLYQNDGALYSPDGKHTTMNSENAINAFTQWVNLYTKYKVPQTTNILTRFRMGESPIVITDYTFYNQLQIGAPEIEGKWAFVAIPGTEMPDGTINRTQASTVTGSLIFANAKDKKSSWEFLKWWTSAETQADYGMEIEALQGPSARWATANIEAFRMLPWANKISKAIEEQWVNVRGVPQVAGGYYTARSLDNAIRTVVNQNENTRETMLDFAADIDEEITIKRKEFNLEVDED